MLLAISEDDYCYGTGTLLLRVSRFPPTPAEIAAQGWITIVGTELTRTGANVVQREVVVRVAALAEAVRPPNWLPRP